MVRWMEKLFRKQRILQQQVIFCTERHSKILFRFRFIPYCCEDRTHWIGQF